MLTIGGGMAETRQDTNAYDFALKALTWRSTVLPRLLAGAEPRELLPTEFAEVESRRADFIARLADDSLLHVEFQSSRPTGLCVSSAMPWTCATWTPMSFSPQRGLTTPCSVC
jgi:hypothetical protein